MPRVVNPTGWSVVTAGGGTRNESGPLVSLVDASGEHRLSIHPLTDRLVRVVRQLPSRPNGIKLRDDNAIGVQWEKRDHSAWTVTHDVPSKRLIIKSPTGALTITVEYDLYLRLTWHWHAHPSTRPFLQDFKRAYPYDVISGRVWHYTASEGYMPSSEHDHDARTQRKYIYGLGETKGPLNKLGRRYVIDGRDSLAADPEQTDPYYKLTPFYLTHDRGDVSGDGAFWHGIYYNTLNSSIFDFGAEHDFSTGDFWSFQTEHGPLDYYVLLGTAKGDEDAMAPPDLPGIVTQLAQLVTPQPLPRQQRSWSSSSPAEWRAAPTLPALSQFGYLASSLTLSERHDAQAAVLEYVREARARRFGIDGMHLSSGYCQDPQTGERHFFVWNKERYPDPRGMADELETGEEEGHCGVIINVKPWLLESHPLYGEQKGAAFVRAAPDAVGDEARAGSQGQSRTWHWSTSMGQTGRGSYFDYSSREGSEAWKALLRRGVLDVGISGVWIDNNEMSTLIDDADQLAGQRRFWSLSGHEQDDDEVAVRMSGWHGTSPIGAWGRATLTMGMAQSTYEALLSASPDRRPVIVTRSAVPGMQTFAGATWSGDNSTTWKALRWSTKLTLSYGLSFGIGLYGHDIGGFAGEHSPSADLLVRWCQQAAWSTRFTVHSWKKISTTLWMYEEATTDHLRSILDWRYRLIPMLYSLYVTDYWKRGWPVLRPLLWYHARDVGTLEQDEQFLLGSHVLVAPVLEAGRSTVTFSLPNVVDGGDEEEVWWYDFGRRKWMEPAPKGVTGRTVTLDCPPKSPHSPFLVRAGGTLVLAPSGMTSVLKPAASHHVRHVIIFPAPSRAREQGGTSGIFTLVEDDGVSNDATERGELSEIEISWAVTGPEEVRVGYRTAARGWRGEWQLNFNLPEGDGRRLVSDNGVRDEAGILCLTVAIS